MASNVAGYLVPTYSTTEGATLEDFFNTVIVALTGLTGDKVRPMFQINPPKIPANSVDWCGFSINEIDSDDNAYYEQATTTATMQRNEYAQLLISFYGVNSMINAKKIRDSLQLGQNRDALRTNGIGITGFTNAVRVPELINDIWYNRVDITMQFAREIRASYNVFTILSTHASTLIKTDLFSELDPVLKTEIIYQS
ncbi:MAG: hypothetical protein LUQ28_12755 [Methylococcaceae bacterium]|nr:hypothetical protein [Methylococcaceae bacterium]